MRMLLLVLYLFPIVTCSQRASKGAALNEDSIPLSAMWKEGVDSSLINRLAADIKNSVYPNIHSLLIARNGKLVFEHYWDGVNLTGTNPPLNHYTKDNLHDLRSISKSVVSACVGIAIAQGKIKSVDQKI